MIHGLTVQLNVGLQIREHSRHVVQHNSWVRVVASTVEPVLQPDKALRILILSLELSLPYCRPKQLHVLGEVTERSGGAPPRATALIAARSGAF